MNKFAPLVLALLVFLAAIQVWSSRDGERVGTGGGIVSDADLRQVTTTTVTERTFVTLSPLPAARVARPRTPATAESALDEDQPTGPSTGPAEGPATTEPTGGPVTTESPEPTNGPPSTGDPGPTEPPPTSEEPLPPEPPTTEEPAPTTEAPPPSVDPDPTVTIGLPDLPVDGGRGP